MKMQFFFFVFLTSYCLQTATHSDEHTFRYIAYTYTCPKFAISKDTSDDPLKDAIIIGGAGSCNQGWSSIHLKNTSVSKFLTVSVNETRQLGVGSPSSKTHIFNKLAPQEKRELGCKGCGSTPTGQLCVSYKIVTAEYVE